MKVKRFAKCFFVLGCLCSPLVSAPALSVPASAADDLDAILYVVATELQAASPYRDTREFYGVCWSAMADVNETDMVTEQGRYEGLSSGLKMAYLATCFRHMTTE